MPYSSKAQMRKFFAMENRGELKKGTAERWAHETPNIKSLPMRLKNKSNVRKKMAKYSSGGVVSPDSLESRINKKIFDSKMITAPESSVLNTSDTKWNWNADGSWTQKYQDKSNVRKATKKYAVGGGVGGEKKESVKRTGTAEDKPGLKALGGTGDYAKATYGPDGKPYTGKVYMSDPKKSKKVAIVKSTEVEKTSPKFESTTSSKAKGLTDGGEVEGEGTEMSDSNEAKIKKGSFIIPAAIRNKLKNLLTSGKKANLNQNGGMPIKLSKGEEVVDPDEAKEIDMGFKKAGVKKGISILAPKSRRKFSAKQFKR